MQRVQLELMPTAELFTALARPSDLARAGQEDEHVAVQPVGDQALERGQHLLLEVAIVLGRQVVDRDVEATALGAQPRTAAQPGRDRLGVERGRHHHQLQILARPELQPPQHRQAQISGEVTLVKFVEQHRAHRRKERIRDQPPSE